MTNTDQLAILATLQRHIRLLHIYEGQKNLSEAQLREVVIVAESANDIINQLQACMDTEVLIERLRGKA